MSQRDENPAADLLIQEVDEELKREQYLRLWKAYGHWIVAAALGIILIVAGYQGWQAWRGKLRQDEAARYAAALGNAQTEPKASAAALAALAQDASTGYGVLARLREAGLLAKAGDVPAALAVYERIADDAGIGQAYRDLAVVQVALLSLDQADPVALERRLAGLTEGPWRHLALELTALLAQRQGDPVRARSLLQRLADDATAPQGVRARAAEQLAVLEAPKTIEK